MFNMYSVYYCHFLTSPLKKQVLFKNTHFNNLQVQKPHKIASIVYLLLSVIVTLFNVTP